MAEYQTSEYDVVVVGAGGAGLRAAVEAANLGVRVGLICKSLLGKAHTVMAEGGAAAAMGNVDDRDNWRVHFADTMRGGQYINNWRMAELHAKEAPARINELEAPGFTVIGVAREGGLLGLLALGDALRPDAADAVRRLHALGIRTSLITGDNEQAALHFARAAGIDEVHARVLPAEKATLIRKLQEGARVVMVGDGINDAPALMQADVGIAFGSGADISTESADVIILNKRLGAVLDAYDRRCAVTGEAAVSALSAARIRVLPDVPGFSVPNGILLRADLSRLFEAGYVTVTTKHFLRVAPSLARSAESARAAPSSRRASSPISSSARSGAARAMTSIRQRASSRRSAST